MFQLNEFSVAVQVTDTSLLAANGRRVGLILSSPAVNPTTISFGGAAVGGVGVVLRAGTAPLVLQPGLWG